MATNNKLLDSNALSAIKTYIDTGAIYSVMSASSVAGSTTSGSQKSVRWYVSDVGGIKTPTNGMKIAINIPRAGNSAGVILSLNGNTDANYHPVLYNTSILTSHYAAGVVKVLVYDSSATASVYVSAGTSVTITGCWKCEGDYDSNSYAYVRQYQAGQNAAGTTNLYPILTRYNLTNKRGTYDTAYTRFYTDTYINITNGYLYAPKVYSGGNEVLTGITSSQVTTALGYTPYNSTNPNGYTSNTGTITGVSVNGTSVATSGVANITSVPWSIISSKPTIPATNVIPAQTTANKVLLSTTTSGTAAWSSWSSAGFLKTNTSGVISIDTNSYLTTSGTAADSSKLGGVAASSYATQTWVTNKGYTTNTGTVTSVTIKAGTGLSSSSTAAITTSGERTISIASGYKLPTTTEWGKVVTTDGTQTITGTKTFDLGGNSVAFNATNSITNQVLQLVLDSGGGNGSEIYYKDESGNAHDLYFPRSSGTLALKGDIQTALTPSLVGYTTTKNNVQGYRGASFTIGTTDNAGFYLFTYGNCMVMLPVANMQANTEYKIAACIVDSSGSYAVRVLTYLYNNGTLYIYQKQDYIPTGYTAYLFKVKLYS